MSTSIAPRPIVYRGIRGPYYVPVVFRNDSPFNLQMSRFVKTVTMDGPEWGNTSPGSHQLAIAILQDCRPHIEAMLLHELFLHEVISKLDPEGFRLDSWEVEKWIAPHLQVMKGAQT